MNAILEQVINARNGHYCHALEVSDVYELQSIIDSLYDEFAGQHEKKVIIDFISSMEMYCLEEANEEEVFNFNISEYIESL
jgi:hypothetical protein